MNGNKLKTLLCIFKHLKLTFLYSIMRITLTTTLLILSNVYYTQTIINTLSFTNSINNIKFEQPNIVVLGDIHPLINMMETHFFIIKNLVQKGYKNIFIEGGESEAIHLNHFLNTGDTTNLKYTKVVGGIMGRQYKVFLDSIYTLNKTNNYGLKFSAIDFEYANFFIPLFNKWFLGNTTPIIELQNQINKLLAIKNIDRNYIRSDKSVEKIFKDVIKTFPKYSADYKNLLGDNFIDFEKIIFNPIFTSESNRDEQMRQLICLKSKTENINKSIIIIGNTHVIGKNRFIQLAANELKSSYNFICFTPIYANSHFFGSNKTYSYKKQQLKLINVVKSTLPSIVFKCTPDSLIKQDLKNYKRIIIEMNNM